MRTGRVTRLLPSLTGGQRREATADAAPGTTPPCVMWPTLSTHASSLSGPRTAWLTSSLAKADGNQQVHKPRPYPNDVTPPVRREALPVFLTGQPHWLARAAPLRIVLVGPGRAASP